MNPDVIIEVEGRLRKIMEIEKKLGRSSAFVDITECFIVDYEATIETITEALEYKLLGMVKEREAMLSRDLDRLAKNRITGKKLSRVPILEGESDINDDAKYEAGII